MKKFKFFRGFTKKRNPWSNIIDNIYFGELWRTTTTFDDFNNNYNHIFRR